MREKLTYDISKYLWVQHANTHHHHEDKTIHRGPMCYHMASLQVHYTVHRTVTPQDEANFY